MELRSKNMFLSFYWVSIIHWELEKLYSFFRGANQWKVPGWKKLSRHDSPIFPKKRPNVICKMASHLDVGQNGRPRGPQMLV